MTISAKQNMNPAIDNIEDWLRENPDVFKQNPQLLELINLPDNRGATSLLERQVEVLRQRVSESQSKQQSIVSMARANEAISDNFMPIFSMLIGVNNLNEFAAQFPDSLKNTFNVDYVGFKLASLINGEQQSSYDEATRRLVNDKTVCDNRFPSSVLSLFFKDSVSSAALIPLLDKPGGKPFGILALGADNAERYTPDLGTVHLDRLGLMAGICLARLQKK